MSARDVERGLWAVLAVAAFLFGVQIVMAMSRSGAL